MADREFLTMEETANTLGVSTRHVRRLADSSAISRVARGLIDRGSVDRYLRSQRMGRTRAWAEHTAWGAVALLAGEQADWLGETQSSRLRQSLRELSDVDELLTRTRDRAQVQTFEAHRAALPRLREIVAAPNMRALGLSDAVDSSIDGYLAASELDKISRDPSLRAHPSGTVTLRVTGFDFERVRALVDTAVVAALDAPTSTDPRVRGVGLRALTESLETFR